MPTVVLTREAADNAPLAGLLGKRGIRVIQAPCLQIAFVAPSEEEVLALPELNRLDAALFASKNGVGGFFSWLQSQAERRTQDRPRLIGAVGPGTARRLQDVGWPPDVVADPATGANLAERMIPKLGLASRVLVVRGDHSRDSASSKLSELGHTIYPLTVYENREPPKPVVTEKFDAVLLASPSAAKRFLQANPFAHEKKLLAIGSTTGNWLRSQGLQPVVSTSTENAVLAETLCDLVK